MRGKRYVEELGRAHRLLPAGRMVVRSTAIEARKGKPGDRARLEPKRAWGTSDQVGGGVL